MKINGYVISLIMIFFLGQGRDASGQSIKLKPNLHSPDLENWTEERLIAWEDSVRQVLYPEVSSGVTKPINGYVPHKIEKKKEAALIVNTLVNNQYEIDKTKAVGEIPVSSSVSPTGAQTYSVPIDISPGIRGFQPALSLVYNSQAGNGVMGMGWNLAGLSAISRMGKSLYYDNQVEGVKLSKSDAFMLDGVRVIKISETSTQINYETEQGFIKVNAFLNGDVTRYFEVLYPNGNKAVFGYTTNNSNPLSYPMTSITDLFGNKITYDYSQLNNRFVINKIMYNTSAVEFVYKTRPDEIRLYSGGLEVKENQLLDKVICKFGTTTLHTYQLQYETKRDVSLLSRIEYQADSKSLNPLRFFYGEDNTTVVFQAKDAQLTKWYANAEPGQLMLRKGKFDYGTENDGLISLPNKNPYWQHYRHSTDLRHSQNRFDNYNEGNEDIYVYTNLDSEFVIAQTVKTEKGFVDIFCANIDGKNEEEVVKVNNYVSGSYDEVSFHVYSAHWYAGLGYKYTRTFKFPTVLTDSDDGKSIHPKFYHVGDFNGDGKMEVLAVSCHNPFGWTDKTSKCYLFDLEGNKMLYEGYAFPYQVDFVGTQQTDPELAFQNTDRLFVLDYDGDGKSDICHIDAQGTHIYSFVVSGSSYTLQKRATYPGLKKTDLSKRTLLVGEFNGDGKPDLLVSPPSGSTSLIWSIYYSKGNGQFDPVTFSLTQNTASKTDGFILQDMNNDGLTDLIKYSSGGFHTHLVKDNRITASADSYTSFPKAGSFIIPTNINSRNYYHQLLALKDGIITKFSYPRNDAKEKLLTGVVTSLGVVDKTYYQMLNESDAYATGGGAIFPYENFQGPLFVPVRSEKYLNGQRVEHHSYGYTNAVVHKQGLGFCGFAKVTHIDNLRGRTFTHEYDPYNFGVLKVEESPWEKSTNTYSIGKPSNKLLRITLSNKSAFDKLKNQTTTYAYLYDAYGNPKNETINYGGGISVVVSRNFENNVNGTSYLLGVLTDVTNTTTRNGKIWSERTFIQERLNGLPKTKIQYANGYQVAYETFAYDKQGNVLEKGVKNYTSSKTWVTKFKYDELGRLKEETDPMSFTKTYEYTHPSGYLTLMQDHKGLKISYEYDEFGRINSISYPAQTVETSSLTWTAGGTNGLYCKTTTTSGEPTVKSYYDALNRETRSSEIRFNGAEAKVDQLYDSYGRLQKVSLPFTSTAASLWNSYEYDAFDRLKFFREASGKTTAYEYGSNNLKTTKDGIASTQAFDTQGNVVSIADPAGTITYNLRPDGQPETIVAPGNVTTSFGYDVYGRQTSITDPSAGVQSVEYNAEGKIWKQTNARKQTTVFDYDSFNRLRYKRYPEFTVTYDYYQNGSLASVTSSNGTGTVYNYDSYGRVYTEQETAVDGKWLQKLYTYTNRNIDMIRYASQSGIITSEKYNYTNGHLTEIKTDNGTSLWKLRVENALGQPTDVATGNIGRFYNFNAYGYPTFRQAGSFQKFSYNFDVAKDNLSSRKDEIRNLTESFSYDGLNRLQNYGGKTMAYDVKGNITRKADAGTYSYTTPGKPYAVSQIDLLANAIAQREQIISYTSFYRPNTIAEGVYSASFVYNGDEDRVKMELRKNGSSELRRYYLGGCYELDEGVGGTKEKLYLGGDYYTAAVVYMKQGSSGWQLYHICRDYQGSITHIASNTGQVMQELSYDAWGRLRTPANLSGVYLPDQEPALFLGRGYTGHEHLPMFGLINMNARLYDPVLGRFLSPDPYIQAPDFSQNFNRYSYCLNNPLKYTDPSGEFFWIPAIIGAIVGSYMGGVVANDGNFNPTKWDYNSGKTWGYMLGGAVIGAGSASLGAAVATSGISMANTAGIATASFTNSLGMNLVTGGQMSIGISLGVASYNFTNGSFGYLGKKGNSLLENVGYGFGALANVSDLVSLFNGGGQNVKVNSASTKDGHEWWGHSSITDESGNSLVSVGPGSQVSKAASLSETYRNSIKVADLGWDTYLGEKGTWSIKLNNVSTNAISKYASGVTRWDLILNSCVGHTSKALWTAGIPNAYLFHPHMLNIQLFVRQLGIYSSPYLYQIP